jgi:hypothetical protein
MNKAEIFKHVLAVHIGIKEFSSVLEDFDLLGGQLYVRPIEEALRSVDVLLPGIETPVLQTGRFSDSIILALVTDRDAAIPAVNKGLSALGVLELSQVAIAGESGDWICVFPDDGSQDDKIGWLLHMERQELFSEQLMEKIQQLIRTTGKPQGPT